jgi:phosphomevalonate kinase
MDIQFFFLYQTNKSETIKTIKTKSRLMNTEQQLLKKWRKLPKERQQQVLRFVESLDEQKQSNKTELGQRLRYIRANILASGEPLLNQEEIEQEVINRRSGLAQSEK